MRIGAKSLIVALCAPLFIAAPAQAQGAEGSPGGGIGTVEFGNFTLLDAPKPVPEIVFQDAAGASRGLEAFRGKVVLLNLWATWCAPCRREMPALGRLNKALGGDDFEVVALAVERGGMDKVRQFLEEIGVEGLEPYIDRSTRSMRTLGAYGLPTTLLIDRKGREIGRLIGAAEWDSPEALDLIRRAIAAHAPSQRAASRE